MHWPLCFVPDSDCCCFLFFNTSKLVDFDTGCRFFFFFLSKLIDCLFAQTCKLALKISIAIWNMADNNRKTNNKYNTKEWRNIMYFCTYFSVILGINHDRWAGDHWVLNICTSVSHCFVSQICSRITDIKHRSPADVTLLHSATFPPLLMLILWSDSLKQNPLWFNYFAIATRQVRD